jgi:hypothetical protein
MELVVMFDVLCVDLIYEAQNARMNCPSPLHGHAHCAH